jgi:hypothetical protein
MSLQVVLVLCVLSGNVYTPELVMAVLMTQANKVASEILAAMSSLLVLKERVPDPNHIDPRTMGSLLDEASRGNRDFLDRGVVLAALDIPALHLAGAGAGAGAGVTTKEGKNVLPSPTDRVPPAGPMCP